MRSQSDSQCTAASLFDRFLCCRDPFGLVFPFSLPLPLRMSRGSRRTTKKIFKHTEHFNICRFELEPRERQETAKKVHACVCRRRVVLLFSFDTGRMLKHLLCCLILSVTCCRCGILNNRITL